MIFFKKYYLMIIFITTLLGIMLIAHSNDYELTVKTVECVRDGQITEELIHQITPKSIYFALSGQALLAFSIAAFISLFFIRNLESEDRKKWTELALNVQENTSKDAIESLFKRIIDERFFMIIKEDLLSAKLIRKYATWKYDITKENDGLRLQRIITYKLENISSSPAVETLNPTLANSSHCTGRILKCVVEKNKQKDDKELQIVDDKKGYFEGEKSITLEPGEEVSVVIIMEQIFSGEYIFETHFTRHPIINLDIMVNFPADFDFNLVSSFSSKCRLKLDEDGVKKYNINGGIFKGQGVEFLCEPKKKIDELPIETDKKSKTSKS